MCSEILVGRSKSKPDGTLVSIFDKINNSKISCSLGFKDQQDFDYTLKWTLAVSNYYGHKSHQNIQKDAEKYRMDLLKIGRNLLRKYEGETEGEAVIIEKIELLDLDHDGSLEVNVKLRKPLISKTVIYLNGREIAKEKAYDNVYLNLWVSYKNKNPQILLSLISLEREGSWGTGHDLIGTVDINGDGIEDVIIRASSGEVVEFEIYEYRNNKLERVFHGAESGC